jgi:hypothetical protein
MGTYVRESGRTVELANNVPTPTTAVTYSMNLTRAININYTITRGTTYRTGNIVIAAASGDDGANLNYSDDYTENSNTGITLTVTQTGSNIFLKYISTATGLPAFLTYSITHLA